MSDRPTPPRRVVVGTGANGKSRVIADGPNPHQHWRGSGTSTYFNEIWTFDACPVDLTDQRDGGERPMSHSPPARGAHYRLIQSGGEDAAPEDRAAADQKFAEMNRTGLSERLQSDRHWNMHRTRTVDYGVVTSGQRLHILPEGEFVMNKGDIVIQLGHTHSWSTVAGRPNDMVFIMIGGDRYPSEA
jgi:hypothetical protein